MAAVLGIDAAWTESGSSGIALLQDGPRGWACVAAEQSYSRFIHRAGPAAEGDDRALPSTVPDVRALCATAKGLLDGSEVDVVAVDMPMANVPITGRRVPDNAISLEFGASWCGTHSPGPDRPGALGATMSEGFRELGFRLATTETPPGETPKLLEVFPHVALLKMMGADRRVPYKVARARRYWPKHSPEMRRQLLLKEWARILEALSQEVRDITLELPAPSSMGSVLGLKPFEDVMDAIVCAWVGVEYLRKNAKPYGDDTAAIWVPESRPHKPEGVEPCSTQPC